MAERKVLNKYYPPDFDPANLPKIKKPKNSQVTVRVMLPMSIQCGTCGEFIYKGRKFNAKKEWSGEEYLGIKIWRFYLKCGSCMAELTFKTDPKNSDYTVEHGASRNFEPWKAQASDESRAEMEKKQEEIDAMKKLENKTLDNKREMEQQDQLEEIKEINDRTSMISSDQLLNIHVRSKEQQDELDDEMLTAQMFGKAGTIIKRVSDDQGLMDVEQFEIPAEDDGFGEESEEQQQRREQKALLAAGLSFTNSTQSEKAEKAAGHAELPASAIATLLPATTVVVKKRKVEDEATKERKRKKKEKKKLEKQQAATSTTVSSTANDAGGLSLLGAYGSDSD